MLTVAIVCGAGASSTFLARRLSDIATASGLSYRFVPSPLETVTVGTADHFGESVEVTHLQCKRDGAPHCLMRINVE